MSPSDTTVVFDLGGVLARICHTWEEAAELANVPHGLAPNGRTGLTAFEAFDQYQAGVLPLETYLRELAHFIGCSADDALLVHNIVIIDEYPGVAELIAELRRQGFRLGCLSNTNEAHWARLVQGGHFPSIESLPLKMASHLVGLNKPDPAIFRRYQQTFAVAPDQIVYFDDHPLNVKGALTEGWRAFLINPEGDTAAQIRTHLGGLGINV